MDLGVEISAVFEVPHIEGRFGKVGEVGFSGGVQTHADDVSDVTDEALVLDLEHSDGYRDIGSLL